LRNDNNGWRPVIFCLLQKRSPTKCS